MLVAATAHASIVTNSVTGIIGFGTDTSGAFGGGDLTGDSGTVSYSFDTAAVPLTTNTATDVRYLATGVAITDASISVTINGITVTVTGGDASFEVVPDSTYAGYINLSAALSNTSNSIQFGTFGQFLVAAPVAAASLSGPLYGNGNTHMFVSGDDLGFFADSAPTIPVPEPASLALLGLLIGGSATMRRRRA